MFLQFILFKKYTIAARALTNVLGVHKAAHFVFLAKAFRILTLLFKLIFCKRLIGTFPLFKMKLPMKLKPLIMHKSLFAVSDVTFEGSLGVVAIHMSDASAGVIDKFIVTR